MAETQKYSERDDFVPNPLDHRGTFQTTRTGVPQNQDAVSEVFAQDRYETAKRVKASVEGEGESTLVYPEGLSEEERQAAEADALAAAEARLAKGEPKSGEPTEAQREAAQETDGDEGATSQSEQPDISDATTQQNTNADQIAAKSVKRDGAARASTATTDGPFDPSANGVDAVNKYLATASDEERERVLTAEREGKNRSTVDGI